jgi:hypothetical protein
VLAFLLTEEQPVCKKIEVELQIESQRGLISMSCVQPTSILIVLQFCTRFLRNHGAP